MALFKFRKGRDEQPAPSKKKKPAPTVEAVRRRAMHRLIGAAVLGDSQQEVNIARVWRKS